MAYSVLQSSLYSSRCILLSTTNSWSKVETLRRVTVDPRSPLGRCISSYCRRKFNLHLLRRPNGIFPAVKQLPIWQILNQLWSAANDKLLVLSVLFGRQFNAIAAQRIRRAVQIINLYNNLGYDQRMVRNIVEKIGSAFPRKLGNRPLGLLLGAAFFSWDKERISEDELTKVADEIDYVQRTKTGGGGQHVDEGGDQLVEWEKVIDKGSLIIWRKSVPNSYLYEYKVYGTYRDLPARAFFAVQVDLEFRRHWDKLVISLDVVDREEETGSEVVHWITHFPYPMYSREYLYIRKYRVDQEKKLMSIINRSIDYPMLPVNGKYVRVDTYMSKMVIKPHTSFDENGFDYVLTYYDDPKANFPSVAYNWMANTGVPDFVEKLHTAAMMLHDRKKGLQHKDEASEDKDRIPM